MVEELQDVPDRGIDEFEPDLVTLGVGDRRHPFHFTGGLDEPPGSGRLELDGKNGPDRKLLVAVHPKTARRGVPGPAVIEDFLPSPAGLGPRSQGDRESILKPRFSPPVEVLLPLLLSSPKHRFLFLIQFQGKFNTLFCRARFS